MEPLPTNVREASLWLKRERERRGISTTEIADRARAIAREEGDPIGLRQQSISAFEKPGADGPKRIPGWLRYVAKAFDIHDQETREDYVAPMGSQASRLKEAMEEVGVDQPELARRVKCTQGAISQILLGNTQRSRYLPEIAAALGIDVTWLISGEGKGPGGRDVVAFDPAAENLALIPQLELGFSMGGGSVIEDYVRQGVYPFPRDWLRSMMQGSFGDLFVARGDGDSMEPTLKDGDVVLIDTAQKDIRQQDRIWAVSYGDLGVIKRVRRQPGGTYQLLSDNHNVSPIHVADGEMHVIGRVIWIGRRI